MNITERRSRLADRRTAPEDRIVALSAKSAAKGIGDSAEYILDAMRPVEAKYTRRLREQGDRVENQLAERLLSEYSGIEFKRQGSVSNNTHIRFYSDVDVLALIDKYVSLERPQVPANPYQGEPLDDLATLRGDCARELRSAFPAATVDNTGSTAVGIQGGSLLCKVDVVPANWFNTNEYAASQLEHHRGVQVLNREERVRVTNQPFLFNYRIGEKDDNHSGVPRMLMRLLKTVRADAIEEGRQIGCSSYDLCSLVYRMPADFFRASLTRPIEIVENLARWLEATVSLDAVKGTLKVVDDSRLIYQDGSTISGVTKVHADLKIIIDSAKAENPGRTVISERHLQQK